MKFTSDNVKAMLMLGAAVGAVYMVYQAKKKAEQVITVASNLVTKDLNPASSQNVIYRNVPLSVKDKIMNFYEYIGL